MTVLDTLNFVAFKPLANTNPIAVRRRKLIAKIEKQKNPETTSKQKEW